MRRTVYAGVFLALYMVGLGLLLLGHKTFVQAKRSEASRALFIMVDDNWSKLPESRQKIENGIETLRSLKDAYYPKIASGLANTLAANVALGQPDRLLAQMYRSLAEGNQEEAEEIFQKIDKKSFYTHYALAQRALKSVDSKKIAFVTPVQWLAVLLLLLVGSIWPVWRWYRRRSMKEGGKRRLRPNKEKAKPNPIWRALALVVDVNVAIVLGLFFALFGMLLIKTIVPLVSIKSNGELAGSIAYYVMFAGALIVYALLRDTIKYQYYRSIGKIFFRLRPVTIDPKNRDDTVKGLMKRNWILLPFFIMLVYFEVAYFNLDWIMLPVNLDTWLFSIR